MSTESRPITTLLARMREGDQMAQQEAMSAVYQEMRRLAGNYMARESKDHTLQPTALVNEAFLRLMGNETPQVNDRQHFYALAARSMRQVLVDHAREKHAIKRGSGGIKVEINEIHAISDSGDTDIVALDEALQKLEQLDARAAKVVELRFFGGYSDKEVAEMLDLSFATVRRDWEFARTWLRRALSSEPE
jgi:RNA polymerase sigma-70 factor, ECF subfamily